MLRKPASKLTPSSGAPLLSFLELKNVYNQYFYEITFYGGGGYGDPHTRGLAEVQEDVIDGYVSRGAAQTEYGVVLRDDSTVDVEATNQRRRDGVS